MEPWYVFKGKVKANATVDTSGILEDSYSRLVVYHSTFFCSIFLICFGCPGRWDPTGAAWLHVVRLEFFVGRGRRWAPRCMFIYEGYRRHTWPSRVFRVCCRRCARRCSMQICQSSDPIESSMISPRQADLRIVNGEMAGLQSRRCCQDLRDLQKNLGERLGLSQRQGRLIG